MTNFLHYVVLFSAYAVLWFLCLFCLLPVGLGAERDPDTGAPLNPMLKKKALIASVHRGGAVGRLLCGDQVWLAGALSPQTKRPEGLPPALLPLTAISPRTWPF